MGKKLLHWAAALAVPALLLDPGRAARESYPVWVDGVQVTSANAGNVLRDAGAPTVRYAPLSNTLVLDGASISRQAGQNAGIYAGKGLRIILLGNSSIANDQVSGRGIFVHGDLEICGTGSLKVDSQGEGIFVCAGGLRVRDSYVGVSSRSAVALCAVAYVDIQGGRMTARARSSQQYRHGIYVPEGDVSVSGGQARACTASISGGYGIYAPKGRILLRDSAVTACAGAHRPSTFVSVFGICAGGLEVSDSRVTATARGGYANGLYADTVRIRSSCITAIAKGANGQGIYAGKLSIQDSQVRAAAEGCYGKGIYADEVTISGGTVSATARGTGGAGILARSVSIFSGTVQAQAEDNYGNGICTWNGPVALTGGTVTARGGRDGCGVAAYNSSNRPVPVSVGPGAVVFANRMEGSRADWRGIVFLDGEEGRMYGWLAVPTDSFTIPPGQVLHINPRQTLALGGAVTLTNRGQLAVSPGGVLLPGGSISSPIHQRPGADASGQPA